VQVPTVKTTATPAQVLGALASVFGGGAPKVALAIAAAQSGVETADWRLMHNWNLWNITPSAHQLSQGIAWMNQGLPMKYIAYGSLLAGAVDVRSWAQHRGYYASLYAGDLDGYMSRLRATCFLGCIGNTDPTGHLVTQADYDAYRAGIAGRIPKLLATTPAVIAPQGWTTGQKVAAGLGVAALAAGAAYAAGYRP
jgi:hypothetical protein